MPTVSVVIPTYKRGREVLRAVESVLRQTFSDLEVIVVDDASPDDTRDVIASVGDARVRYLAHDKNKGGCAARNTGMVAARGRWIAFLDDDDEWVPTKLQKQLDVARTSKLEPGVVLCGIQYTDEVVPEGKQSVTMPRGRVYEDILHRRMRVSAVTMLIDTARVGKVLFEETAGEEFGYALELASRTPFDYAPERLVRVHRNLGRNPHNGIQGRLRALERYQDAFKAHPKALARHRYELGLAYLDVKDTRLARSYFWKSIEANPRDFRPWTALALMTLGASDLTPLRSLRDKLARRPLTR
jgi:glycosyltransferase involved in cell wall biosynthesis